MPQEDTADKEPDSPLNPVNDKELSNHENYLYNEQDEVASQSVEDDESRASPNFVPRVHQELIKTFPHSGMV